MNKKVVQFKEMVKRMGGEKMEATICRKVATSKEYKVRGASYCCEPVCEMRGLMEYAGNIIKRNGYTDEEVSASVDKVCGRNVKSSSRY